MASKYWIKLYHEILHDPKMGTMPDHLWRRAIEMMLIAGDANDGGWLPTVRDMAWTLRCDEGELAADLDELQRIGLVTCDDGAWFVTNFATRQGAMPAAERMRRARADAQHEQYSVTNANTIVTEQRDESSRNSVTKAKTDIDIDIDTDKDVVVVPPPRATEQAPQRDALTAQFYDALSAAGVMVSSQAQAQAYNEVIEDIRGTADPPEFVRQLFNEAAATTSGRITPRWFEVVVDRCLREGCMPGDKRTAKGRDAPTKGGSEHSLDEWAAIAAQFNGGRT